MAQNYIKQERNSSIELLKIVAILLIVISHSIPRYGTPDGIYCLDITTALPGLSGFITILFGYGGQVGNCLFLCASAYFLSTRTDKNGLRKIISLESDVLFVSWAFLIIGLVYGHLSYKNIISSLFPTIMGSYWYVTDYMLLLLAVPYLNKLIHQSSDKELFNIALVFFLLYSVAQLYDSLFFSSSFIQFIGIYFIVAYFKRIENQLSNKRLFAILLIGVIGYFSSIIALYVAIPTISHYLPKFEFLMGKFCFFSNPFIVCIAIASVFLVTRFCFYSKCINRIASYSLLIYILTDNCIFRDVFKPQIPRYYIDKGIGHIEGSLLFAAICFIGSLLISDILSISVRPILRKACNRLADRLHI